MLRAGEAHAIVSPPTESVESLQSESDIEVLIYDSLTQISWEMRVTAPPFDDVRVRHAMNYAVDKQAIIDEIMSGLGKIARTPAPPGVWGAIELEPYDYDPEQAKALMEEAGYADGFDGVFFFVPGRWAGDEQVAQATQSFWAQIGARMEINTIDMGSLGEWLSRDPDEMAGAIAGLIRTSTYIDYQLFRLFHPVATTEVASQRSGYVNEQVGELIDEARATFDLDERAELYAEVQRLVWEDAPFVWLFTRQDVVAHQAGLIGLTVLPDGLLLFNDVQLPA
jgi:peptide/nickel transport system substrate-binding protein